MEPGSHCDDVPSGSETSRDVKSVLCDDADIGSAPDLASLSEGDDRSDAERDDLL